MGKVINIFAPATVANLGPGFDILGLALNDVGDFIEMEITNDKQITIEMENLPELPTDPKINAAGVALQALLSELGSDQGFSIKIRKNVRPGSGLGSSASSSAGAVFAANELLGQPFTKHQLVEFAMQGEGAVSGKPHADNVAPSLLGGVPTAMNIALDCITAFLRSVEKVSLPAVTFFLIKVSKFGS